MRVGEFITLCKNTQLLHKLGKADASYNPVKEGLWLLHESDYGEAHLVFVATTGYTMYWHKLMAHDIDNATYNKDLDIDFKALFEFCETDKHSTYDDYIFPVRISDEQINSLIKECASFDKHDTFNLKSISKSDKEGEVILNFIIGWNHHSLNVPAQTSSSLASDRQLLQKIYERMVLEEGDFSQHLVKADTGGDTYIQKVQAVLTIMKIFHSFKVDEIRTTLYNSICQDRDNKKYLMPNHIKFRPDHVYYDDPDFGVIEMVVFNAEFKHYV